MVGFGDLKHTLRGGARTPYFYNGKKGPKRGPLGSKTLLKTQTRWDGKDPTPRSHQRTGLNPPWPVTKPGPPIQSLSLTPLWGHGVRGWEGEYYMVAEKGQILTSLGGILPSSAS